jgi:outer membrane protein OmpA-like peptidoglycan-associated protein
MGEEPTATEPAKAGNGGRRVAGTGAEFAALRRLLVGPEQSRLDELTTAIRDRRITAADLAEQLPEAIRLRGQRDEQIGRALAPVVDSALSESIRRDPREIATAIFPVLGPAIRKAIAETMAGLVRTINSAVEHSLTPRGIKWRLESWRTGVPYAQVVIKHALVYRVEQAFLVHAESGLLLAHATAPGIDVPEADLISGMLTAIQDFVRDAFRPGEEAMLRTFSAGELTVQVEVGPRALIALVIRGQAPDAVLLKQQDTLETIHLQFATALLEFTGDSRPFDTAVPLLEECLETVVDTSANRRGSVGWMHWFLPAAAVALAAVALSAWSTVRFERGVAALRREPGFVVTEARRRLRDWSISGLRDPQARSPQTVLASAGVAPPVLRGDWKPYLSLDSAVIAARARTAWGLAPTTGLAVRGDTVTLTGDLPLGSVGRLHLLPAGVTWVALENPRIVLPPHLDSMRESVTQDRVYFARGSAEVRAGEDARLRLLALRFRALRDSLASVSADGILTLLGRTDMTGSNERNAALAEWRVDRVTARLAAAGLAPASIRGIALATSQPLEAADSTERARINRSVSYDVIVVARPGAAREH